jgi:biotin-(acetyl-CoA carboxylase) ligase
VGPAPAASFVVLGIGLNVSQRADDWPVELRGRAVSLAELGHSAARPALLAGMLARLARRYEALLDAGRVPAIGAAAAAGGEGEA